jgi:hypothetical protein
MRFRRLALFALIAATLAPAAPAAAARATAVPSVFAVAGDHAPGTPLRYDRVMVRRYGSASAKKVLVLMPGTLAGAADFSLVGPYLAAHVPGLQVWAEMRRDRSGHRLYRTHGAPLSRAPASAILCQPEPSPWSAGAVAVVKRRAPRGGCRARSVVAACATRAPRIRTPAADVEGQRAVVTADRDRC